MNQEFDYQEVPHGFGHCFRDECPRSQQCLRHTAATHSAAGDSYLTIINPAHLPADTSSCPFFLINKKTRVAWGLKSLYDNIPVRKATNIRQTLLSHYGKPHYYRIYRKERYLDPKDQTYIRRVLQHNGVQEEPAYEYYTELYKW